jgi:hypothetical protein
MAARRENDNCRSPARSGAADRSVAELGHQGAGVGQPSEPREDAFRERTLAGREPGRLLGQERVRDNRPATLKMSRSFRRIAGATRALPSRHLPGCLAASALALALTGCGAAGAGSPGAGGEGTGATTVSAPAATTPRARPQVVEPSAGAQAAVVTPSDPVGDVNAHAPPLSQVRAQLALEVVAAQVSSATYINPLRYVTSWERTDQGVDARLPVGAPILAPSRIKILDIEPDWYLDQPLVYFELLDGPDAGKVQYVAEQITDIARPGSILTQGQVIARYASSGTAIEYGWATLSGVTLAVATTGYEEGEITPAGRSMRAWLNALGAGAGPNT